MENELVSYIKKRSAIDASRKIGKKEWDAGNVNGAVISMLINDEIIAIPSENVQRVVFCKDCALLEKDEIFGGLWCRGRKVSPLWFCADGHYKSNEVELS